MPTTSSPRSSRRRAQCMPMNPATPVTSTFIWGQKWGVPPFSSSLGAAQLDQLHVFDVAVHAADRDMHEPRQAVEEAQAHEVELEEAHHRREQEVRHVRAAALLERLARGERGVAVLPLEIRREIV